MRVRIQLFCEAESRAQLTRKKARESSFTREQDKQVNMYSGFKGKINMIHISHSLTAPVADLSSERGITRCP